MSVVDATVISQTQMEIDKAMADDPTVYAYDDLYDDMKRKEKEAAAQVLNQSKGVEKKVNIISGQGTVSVQ